MLHLLRDLLHLFSATSLLHICCISLLRDALRDLLHLSELCSILAVLSLCCICGTKFHRDLLFAAATSVASRDSFCCSAVHLSVQCISPCSERCALTNIIQRLERIPDGSSIRSSSLQIKWKELQSTIFGPECFENDKKKLCINVFGINVLIKVD